MRVVGLTTLVILLLAVGYRVYDHFLVEPHEQDTIVLLGDSVTNR